MAQWQTEANEPRQLLSRYNPRMINYEAFHEMIKFWVRLLRKR
jgi:hypothetical protein